MRAVARALTLGAIVALVSGGCGGPERPSHTGDPALDADVRVSPTPAAVGRARVFVEAVDGVRPAVGVTVRVRAEAVDASGADPGVGWHALDPAPETPGGYGPIELSFPTPGPWRVEVEIVSPDGRSATIRHPLAVVEGPAG